MKEELGAVLIKLEPEKPPALMKLSPNLGWQENLKINFSNYAIQLMNKAQ